MASNIRCFYNTSNVNIIGKHNGCNIKTDKKLRLYKWIETTQLDSAKIYAVIARHPATLKKRDLHSVNIWQVYYDAWASLSLIYGNIHLYRYETLISSISPCTAIRASKESRKYLNTKYKFQGNTLSWQMWNYSNHDMNNVDRIQWYIPLFNEHGRVQYDFSRIEECKSFFIKIF